MLGGRCSWRVLPRLGNGENQIFSGNTYDVHLPGPAFDFLRFFTKRFKLRAVDRSVLYHLSPRPAPSAPQSLSHNLRRHLSPSLRPARGCVSYFLCVLRDEHQSISFDLSVHFLSSTAAADFACYTAGRLLSATSSPNTSTSRRRW